jgi:hypothetical protein
MLMWKSKRPNSKRHPKDSKYALGFWRTEDNSESNDILSITLYTKRLILPRYPEKTIFGHSTI